MEAEKMAAERKAEMASVGVSNGDDEDFNGNKKKKAAAAAGGLHSSVRSAKASKHPTKAQLDGDDPIHKRSKKKKQVSPIYIHAIAICSDLSMRTTQTQLYVLSFL
jgi:hypothetical protein